ncbi:unnamed protein product [Ascophyllum nodosum]
MASLQANGATITAPGSNGLGGAGNQGYFGVMSQASGMGVQVGNNVDRVWRLPTQEDRDASINMLPNADPTTLHSCDACNKDITGLCYIRCAECKGTEENPHDVDLCVDCFYRGKEPLNHKRNHSYRVMDKLSTPVYTEDWTAAEELSLADQTRRLGLGAWEDIADSKLFYRGRSASELHTRYMDTYLCRYGSVLPPHYLKRRPDGALEKVEIPLTIRTAVTPSDLGKMVSSREIRSRTIADLDTEPEFRYEPSFVAKRKRGEEEEKAKAKYGSGSGRLSSPPGGGKAAALSNGSASLGGSGGYSSGFVGDSGEGSAASGVGGSRDEAGAGGYLNSSAAKAAQSRKKKFKKERGNKNKEEERMIKEWVEQLPGADLSGYLPLRGDFEFEHDNGAEELLADMEFRPTDHASEKQLKLDDRGVQPPSGRERSASGSSSSTICSITRKSQQEDDQGLDDRELIARLRPFARFHSAKEHEELIENLLLAKKMRARIEQLQAYRENGITTLAEGAEFDNAKKRRRMTLASKKHRESASYLYDGHTKGTNSTKGTKGTKGGNRDRSNRYTSRSKDGADGDEDGRGSNLLDLTGAPGVEFLSPAERLLCSQLHLLPGYFLVIKDAMVQECIRSGCLKRKSLSNLAVMDASRLDKMYDFFATCGWVTDNNRDSFVYNNNSTVSNSSNAVNNNSSINNSINSNSATGSSNGVA